MVKLQYCRAFRERKMVIFHDKQPNGFLSVLDSLLQPMAGLTYYFILGGAAGVLK